MAPGIPTVTIGIRPGEKLHEEMISSEESRRTVQQKDRYVVQPTLALWGNFTEATGAPVPEGFAYNSENNDQWLSVDDLRRLIAELGL
jgi:UDP-N-acetylglucosamine 4,6-dehydratase